MTKPPKLASNDDMIAFGANEDVAKATIGTIAIQLFRAGQPVSWPAIVASLRSDADGNNPRAGAEMLAKGALRFIESLPSNKAG